MKVKSESEVAQSCLTLHDPLDCSLPGSSTHGIFHARVLEWGAIAFSIKYATGPLSIFFLLTLFYQLKCLIFFIFSENIHWLAHYVYMCLCVCVCVSHSVMSDSCDPMDCVPHQAPLSMECSRQ